jgi:hypothetical protein
MPVPPLNLQNGMPQMSAAFSGWTVPMTWALITQTVVNGFPVDTETTYTIEGVFQPLSAEEIQLKPDAQWSWPWYMLHIVGKSQPFRTNDRIKFNGLVYKVMGKKDYSLNNYSQLDLVEDYQPNAG